MIIINTQRLSPDIVKLLLTKYLDPVSKVRCLRVCKSFNKILIPYRKKIIDKVVNTVHTEHFYQQLSELYICPECNQLMGTKSNLIKHLHIHTYKVMVAHDPVKIWKCQDCNIPRCRQIKHKCKAKTPCQGRKASFGYSHPKNGWMFNVKKKNGFIRIPYIENISVVSDAKYVRP